MTPTDDDAPIQWAQDKNGPGPASGAQPWRILMVDDAPDMHAATRLSLGGFVFEGRPLELVSAFSAAQAKTLLSTSSDFALAFIDVVMETDLAGLELVQWIRQSLKEDRMRIVMRTGQAGYLPKETATRDYDIDDFKEKAEFTATKLRALLYSKLRAYRHICALAAHGQTLAEEVERRTAQLHSAHAQLRQSEKLAAIGQLAAGVAHEINTPISYMLSNHATLEGYHDDLLDVLDAYEAAHASITDLAARSHIEALKARCDLPFVKDDLDQLMGQTLQGIHRVGQIVRSLQKFSRGEATPQWQYVNLNECIDSTLTLFRHELQAHADVVTQYAPLPDVQCLPAQINQVVLQLLINAAHAMQHQRGTITVTTGCDSQRIWVRVADTGAGIEPQALERLFDPFFTTKDVGQGTGLGLSQAYGIVQQHHGRIEVQSTMGAGSTFTVTLPLQQNTANTP